MTRQPDFTLDTGLPAAPAEGRKGDRPPAAKARTPGPKGPSAQEIKAALILPV